MAILKKKSQPDTPELPDDFLAKIERGRQRLESIAPRRDECWEFFRGNHYAYVDEQSKLQTLSTTTSIRNTGKPAHRARQSRNLIFDVVLRALSAATQRIPSYQVVPSGRDPKKESAAGLAEKVLLYGHGKWNVRQAAVDAVTHAVVSGEAFAWPYFDNQIGPFIQDGQGNAVGTGEICIRIFGGNECYWEPGLKFDDSSYHVIEQAVPLEEVKKMDGFLGVELTPDADSRQLSNRGQSRQGGTRRLVLVSHYLERPSPTSPSGRWIVMANKQRIVPDRPYPGSPDKPVLRRLIYAPDPDSDRSLGLVSQLLDPMRTYNDANNKAVELKNHYLLPRLIVAPGMMKKQRWTDEPGKALEIPNPSQNVMFAPVPDPSILDSLLNLADRAQQDIGRISANNDIPSGITANSAIQSLLDSDQSRLAMFLNEVAEWYSNIAHDCLVLVQEYYTEPRTLAIRGDFGWESIEDFYGAALRNELDVRVLPESITPQTKEDIEQRIMNYVQMGAISPDEAVSAIERGSADTLLRSMTFDESRAGRIIQWIKAGPDVLFNTPELPTGRTIKEPVIGPDGQPVVDPTTGQPQQIDTGQPEMAPAWMPRYSDNIPVFKAIFEDWFKTEEFETIAGMDPDMAAAAANIYTACLQLEAQKAQEQQDAMSAQASQMGMNNAANPQPAKPMPSMPSVNGGGDQNQSS